MDKLVLNVTREGSLTSNSLLQYRTKFGHNHVIAIQFLMFPPIPTTSSSLINRHIICFLPQTQPYTYPFNRLDGIIKWSQPNIISTSQFIMKTLEWASLYLPLNLFNVDKRVIEIKIGNIRNTIYHNNIMIDNRIVYAISNQLNKIQNEIQ